MYDSPGYVRFYAIPTFLEGVNKKFFLQIDNTFIQIF